MGRVQTIINGSDNVNSIVLYEAGTAKDLSSVTQVKIYVDDADSTVLDSDVLGDSVIWWDETVSVDGEDVDAIRYVGADLGLDAGVYRDCKVKLIDAVNTDGIDWPDPVTLVVS